LEYECERKSQLRQTKHPDKQTGRHRQAALPPTNIYIYRQRTQKRRDKKTKGQAKTEELRETSSAGAKGELVLGAALGSAQVGGDSDARALFEEVLDGWHGSADSGVVGDLLAIKWHVEVAADEHLRHNHMHAWSISRIIKPTVNAVVDVSNRQNSERQHNSCAPSCPSGQRREGP
jgi:hypothetical protein